MEVVLKWSIAVADVTVRNSVCKNGQVLGLTSCCSNLVNTVRNAETGVLSWEV